MRRPTYRLLGRYRPAAMPPSFGWGALASCSITYSMAQRGFVIALLSIAEARVMALWNNGLIAWRVLRRSSALRRLFFAVGLLALMLTARLGNLFEPISSGRRRMRRGDMEGASGGALFSGNEGEFSE